MSVRHSRPPVDRLVLRLYDRALHPELFAEVVSGRVKFEQFELTVGLCDTGHLIQFTTQGETLTEVLLDRHAVLPTRGQQVYQPIEAERVATLEIPGIARVHTRTLIEYCETAAQYSQRHRLVAKSVKRAWLQHNFADGYRLREPALSGLSLNCGARHVQVQTWHTFPETCEICEVESLFELV